MILRILSLITLFHFVLSSCETKVNSSCSQKAVQVNLLSDTFISYSPKHPSGFYIKVIISNNSSFPICITTIGGDSSINYIDSYYFTAENFIIPTNANFMQKESIGVRNDFNTTNVNVSGDSTIIGKILWLHDNDLRFKSSKFIYQGSYEFYKVCLNELPTVYNMDSFPEKDSLKCGVYYRQDFYCLVEMKQGTYHIQQLEISGDSMLREMRNKYL